MKCLVEETPRQSDVWKSNIDHESQRGETACSQCGLVVAETAVDIGPEPRSFDQKRTRTAPLKLVIKPPARRLEPPN